MKNIFQNQSIKKAAAAGMIAAQVSMGTNFLSESFVDNAFAESGFYNAWNSSIFRDLVPDYSATYLDINGISNTETETDKTKCVLDSDSNLSINPKAYSIDTDYSDINNKLKSYDSINQTGFANKIEYSALPSLDGIFAGLASSTYSFGPNYNSDVSVSVNMTSPDPGTVNQLTSDSFDYTPNPLPTFDYATGTYTAINGLGDTVNGVVVYNNIGPKRVNVVNVNYNTLSDLVGYPSDAIPDIVQNPANGTILNNFGGYYYKPNPGYTGQDFFTIRDTDFYVSILKQSPTNGFEGGNFYLNSGVSGYYSPNYGINPLGHFRFYKPSLFTSLQNFYNSFLYKLSSPTSTIPLPQLSANGSSTSFIIDTLSSFYTDFLKTPNFEFRKQFTVVVEHDNRAPVVVVPTSSTNFVISGATGTVNLTSDYKDLEGDSFDLIYEVSNDNFATILATSTNGILSTTTSATSSNINSFVLPRGTYQYRVKAVENNPTQNCIGYTNASGLKIASSTSALKSFTVSNAPLPVNLAPIAIPTSPANFVISGATGTIPLSSGYKDFEGDNFDLFYEVYEASSSIPIFNEVYDIPDSVPNATSSHTSLGFDLSVGTYQYRLIAEDFSPTNNGGVPASSTSAFKSFVVSNTVVTPTSTPTTTPAVTTPLAPVAPQGGLLPLILITPEPTMVVPTTTPTTTEIKSPVKEVLGLNPEDSDDLLPGETPAAYLIRMEKRRVLGRSGSKDLLVETGSNNVLKIFAGVTLLAGVMLLLKNRKEKRGKIV